MYFGVRARPTLQAPSADPLAATPVAYPRRASIVDRCAAAMPRTAPADPDLRRRLLLAIGMGIPTKEFERCKKAPRSQSALFVLSIHKVYACVQPHAGGPDVSRHTTIVSL
jgi:hypothetical protein